MFIHQQLGEDSFDYQENMIQMEPTMNTNRIVSAMSKRLIGVGLSSAALEPKVMDLILSSSGGAVE